MFRTSPIFNNVQGQARTYKIELHHVLFHMEDSVRINSPEKEDAVGKPRRDTKAVAAPDEGN